MLDTAEAPTTDPLAESVRSALLTDLDVGFSELMNAYQNAVYSVALSSSRSDAEDLAAEAFLKAYRALRSYDADRIRSLQIKPWLMTIVRNTARNAAREASRRPAAPPLLEPTEETDPGRSVEDQVQSRIEQDQLRGLLARLPEVQRAAVVLHHIGELSNSEVGHVLGCPEGTAKSHVSRGLRRLRSMVVQQAGEQFTLTRVQSSPGKAVP